MLARNQLAGAEEHTVKQTNMQSAHGETCNHWLYNTTQHHSVMCRKGTTFSCSGLAINESRVVHCSSAWRFSRS
jgi:hypothetical protein